jgi:hypothetical protein
MPILDMQVITVVLQTAQHSVNRVIPFLEATQSMVLTSGLTTRKWRFLVPSVTLLCHRIRGVWASARHGAWICLITWSKGCIIFSLHESLKCKPSTSSLRKNTRRGSSSKVLTSFTLLKLCIIMNHTMLKTKYMHIFTYIKMFNYNPLLNILIYVKMCTELVFNIVWFSQAFLIRIQILSDWQLPTV